MADEANNETKGADAPAESTPVVIKVGTSQKETVEEKKKREPSKKERADALKKQANKEFGQRHYVAAIQLYDKALELDPHNHILYSNRSVARFNLAQEISKKGDLGEAKAMFQHLAANDESPSWTASMSLYFGSLEDALKCIEIEPNFLKAYLRVGAALMALGKYHAALQTYEATLARFPDEEIVKTAMKEALEKTAKMEEGFPLFHSFLGLIQPTPQPAGKPASPSPDLFRKRNTLICTPKPEGRWQFYFGQPPNPRSSSGWEPESNMRNNARRPTYTPRPTFQSEYQRPTFQSEYQRPTFQSEYQRPTFQSEYQRPESKRSTSYQDLEEWDDEEEYIPQPQQRKRSEGTPRAGRNAVPQPGGYLEELCEKLRISQYLPALIEQGVETVDDLMLLPTESIQRIIPTLGHQARVIEWIKRARA